MNKTIVVLLGVLGCLAIQLPARAAPPIVTKLASGATLIIAPEPDSPLVAIDVFFQVGYAEERQSGRRGKPVPEGITALLTQAWLGGSEGRGAETLARDIGGLGGNVGANAGGDYVELYAVTSAGAQTFQKAAATLITNVIGRPLFDDAAIETARQSQLRALLLQNDQLFASALGRVRGRLWDDSPYAARSPLGTEKSVRAITPAQVRAFYATFFRPDRAVIVVTGNVDAQTAQKEIEANIGASGWAEKGASPTPLPLAPETLARTPPDVSVGRRARVTVLMAGFLAPGTEHPDDYAALLLVDALAGGGKGGRLFREVRDERGIGYDVGSLVQPGRYQSLLAGYLATVTLLRGPNGPRSVLGEVSGTLLDALRSLASAERPPTGAEIARAKAFVKGRYALRHERLKERAFLLGWSEVMGLGASFDTTFDARMDAVTPDAIQRMARTVLGGNHVFAVTLPER